jgi:1-acyl-sn-glycerol-3-phosphate acyltransferase
MKWWVQLSIATAVSAFYWSACATCLMLLAFTLGLILPVRWTRPLGQAAIHTIFSGFTLLLRVFGIITLEMHGFEKLAHAPQGYILAPNHPALWDAVFIIGRVPGLTCILKTSLLNNPLLLGGAKLARFIPGTPMPAMLRQCVTALKGGQNLLLFPEATRTRVPGCLLNELKGGVGIVASQAMAPIWPVVIQTSSHYLSKGWPLWRWPHERVAIRITLLDSFAPEAADRAQDVLEKLRQRYLALLSPPSDEVAHPHPQL